MKSSSKKYFRDSTAEAKVTSDVMVIKKRELDDHLRLFQEIRGYMAGIANEKVRYHQVLINQIIANYKNPEISKRMFETRMMPSLHFITTYLSLKRQLSRKKVHND